MPDSRKRKSTGVRGWVRVSPEILRRPRTGTVGWATLAYHTYDSGRHLEAVGATVYVALWCAKYETGGEFPIGVWDGLVVPWDAEPAQLLRVATKHGLVRRLSRNEYALGPAFSVARATRLPIADDVRRAVYERDHFRCVACGTTDDLSVDHIVAWSKGGLDDPSNLQTLCRSCNARKGTRGEEAAVS